MKLFQAIIVLVVAMILVIFAKSVHPTWIPASMAVLLFCIGGYLMFDYLEGN